MKDTASENSRILMDVIIARGVETIIISPGSRNTPLIIAAEAREKLKKYVINQREKLIKIYLRRKIEHEDFSFKLRKLIT